jgi:hypothetical protein
LPGADPYGRSMAFNPPSLSDAPDPGAVVGAVADATENSTDAAAAVVDTVVEAVVDAVPPPPDDATASVDVPDMGRGGNLAGLPIPDQLAGEATIVDLPGIQVSGGAAGASVTVTPGDAIDAMAGVATAAATGTVAAATGAAAVAGDVIEDVRDTEVRGDAGGVATVTHNDDGSETVDFGGHLGVEVDGNEVGVSSILHDTTDADGSAHTDADTGGFVDVDGHHTEAGITYDSDESKTLGTQDTTMGVYAEHDDDRVEGGIFQTTDSDVGPGGHESNRLTETGFYGEHDGDQVRVGTTDDKGEAGDVLHSGVFVQDADGDRTGVGTISDSKMSADTFEVGTGGVYVDVDGERHDMHAEGGIVMVDGEVEVEGEFDPGPVSVSGRAGVVTDGPDRGTAYARGEQTTETNRVGDDAAGAARGAIDDLNDDVDGALDGLPHIDGLDDPGMDLPDLPEDDPTTDGGSILDDLDPPVVVHDGLGDPLEDFHDSALESVDATDAVVDPNDGTDEDDGSALDSVTAAVGDAVGAVGDAVGNVIEDLFD